MSRWGVWLNHYILIVSVFVSIHPSVRAVVPGATDGGLEDEGVVFGRGAVDLAGVAHGSSEVIPDGLPVWEDFGKILSSQGTSRLLPMLCL